MKILANALHAGIWCHSFPEELVLRSLSEDGHEVVALRCDGTLNKQCVTISGMGLGATSSSRLTDTACRKCQQRRRLLEFRSSVRSISLSECLSQTDFNSVEEVLQELTPFNWYEYEFRGHKIARTAAYEFVLEHKLNSYTIPDNLWSAFVGNVRSTSLSLCAASTMMESLSPDLVISYNALYSVNNIVSIEARRRGIKTWAMHSGLCHVNRYERLNLYDARTISNFSYSTSEWSHYLRLPLNPDDSTIATSHFLELLRGNSRFSYSKHISKIPTSEIRVRLNIPPHRKVLLATLTSGDEIFAAGLAGLKAPTEEESVFESSLAWLQWLIQEMSNLPDCHLVIRVHPRELPNKRDGVTSKNSTILRDLLSDLPSAISVNWPDDELSLYDLAQITDVCMNFTSSAGIEMMMLGIPTVIPHNAFMAAYAPEISLRARSLRELSAHIKLALEQGWSSDYTRLALKWWGFFFNHVGIDISDRFSYPSSGYIKTDGSKAGRFASGMLMQLALSSPPVIEIKHLLRAGKLREIERVTQSLQNDDSYVIQVSKDSDYSASTLYTTEIEIVRTELKRILEELSQWWEPESHVFQSISNFVSGNLLDRRAP